MKIVTVNIPEAYIESIKRLVGEDGLYPSRSELIRVAVRDFLVKELKMANEMIRYNEVGVEEVEKLDEKKYVRVPIEKMDENNKPVKEFKTYKIIKRLEYWKCQKQRISQKRKI